MTGFTGGKTYYASSAYLSSQNGDKAFDNSLSSYWQAKSGAGGWVAVDLGVGGEKTANWFRIYPLQYSSYLQIKDFELQGSNNSTDGSDGDWDVLGIYLMPNTYEKWMYFNTTNTNAYRWYRINVISSHRPNFEAAGIKEIQIFEDNEEVDGDFTFKAQPYESHDHYSSDRPEKAFDDSIDTRWQGGPSVLPQWLAIDLGNGFEKAISILRLMSKNSPVQLKDFKLQGSNDSTTGEDGIWTDLLSETHENKSNWQEYIVVGSIPYRWYRIYITSSYRTDYLAPIITECEMIATEASPPASEGLFFATFI